MGSPEDVSVDLIDFMQLAVSLMDSIRTDMHDGGQITSATDLILTQMEEKYEKLDALLDANNGETH